jgi:lipopolysaccharide export LptBFGC system permease protein LptF
MGKAYEKDFSKIRESLKQLAPPEISARNPLDDRTLSALFYSEYNKRDKMYTELLRHYIDTTKLKSKLNESYKRNFYRLVMAIFVGLAISFVALSIAAFFAKDKATGVGLATANVAGLISAIIVLPRIIAKHLFPENEDEHMVRLVEKMQNNDTSIRNFCPPEENGIGDKQD